MTSKVAGARDDEVDRPVVGGPPAPPVFLLGAPRSGTSLLYKVLCLHPEAAWISNYHRRRPSAPQLNLLNRTARVLPSARQRVWFGDGSNAYVYGDGRRALSHRLFPMPVEGETVFTWAGLTEDAALARQPRSARDDAIRHNLASVVRWAGGRVLVSKRIGHNRRVPLLASAFPGARYVHLVRDGRAVAMSLGSVDWWPDLHVWWYGGTPQQWAQQGRDPWELRARHWVEEVRAVRQGLAEVPAQQVLEVTYEQLVQDPWTTLEEIRAFAGLRADDGWTSTWRALRFPNRNERWREQMSAAEQATVTGVQEPVLAELGYQP